MCDHTSHHYKRVSKEFCTQKMKAYKTMRGQASKKPQKKKRQGIRE
jgi:hypothetical protein